MGESCVGCQILSVLHITLSFSLCVCLQHLRLPSFFASYLSQVSTPPLHLTVTPGAGSQTTLLRSSHTHTQRPSPMEEHRWCICSHRLQTGAICVWLYIFFFLSLCLSHAGGQHGWQRGPCGNAEAQPRRVYFTNAPNIPTFSVSWPLTSSQKQNRFSSQQTLQNFPSV